MTGQDQTKQPKHEPRDYANAPAYLLRPMSTWTEAEWKEFNSYEDAARKASTRWDRMRGE